MAGLGPEEESLGLKPDPRARLRTRLLGCLLSAFIIAAPFVGLLYSVDLALGIAVVALLAAASVVWQGRRDASSEDRGRLCLVALINVGLALLVATVLVLRLIG